MARMCRRPPAACLALLALFLLTALAQAPTAVAAPADHVHDDESDTERAAAPLHHDPDQDVADEDDEPNMGLSKADVGAAASLELSKADIKTLSLREDPTRRIASGPGDDSDGANADAVSDRFSNLGLSNAELAELKKMEDDTRSEDAPFHGRKDKRFMDAALPPGMAAIPEKHHLVDHDRNRDPPRPHQPKEADGFPDLAVLRRAKEAKELSEKQAIKAAALEARAASEREGDLRARIDELTKALKSSMHESSSAKAELAKSLDLSKKALESERQEHTIEKEELAAAIEERKRAFDELYEEKQVLGQILSDEQKTLRELQDKIQHPDLGLWIRQRAERASILVETPETDAMKFYARKYMAPKVTKMRHRLELLEKRVEKSVDHLLPSKYGSVVALLLCIGLIGFPMFVTFSTVWSVTKSVSLRQYVLLGNVFLTAFSSGLCIAGLILRQDPLQTLYEASESMFVILQLATAIAFPVFVGVIFCAVLKSRDQEDLFVFGCELVFYVLVGLNYRVHVWRPAMLGENIQTSRMMYVVYVIDFLAMTALTVSSAKVDRSRTGSVGADGYAIDVETAVQDCGKLTGAPGSTSLASARSGFEALGSGLMKAARGSNEGRGKEE